MICAGMLFRKRPLEMISIYFRGMKYVTGCSQTGMFSIGVANPDNKIEGIIKTNVPKTACCCVEEIEEINNPTPLIAVTKVNKAKRNRSIEPVKGTFKIKTPTTINKQPSSIPTMIPGMILPIKISNGTIGETSN